MSLPLGNFVFNLLLGDHIHWHHMEPVSCRQGAAQGLEGVMDNTILRFLVRAEIKNRKIPKHSELIHVSNGDALYLSPIAGLACL